MTIEIERLEGHVEIKGTAKAIAELQALKKASNEALPKDKRHSVTIDTDVAERKIRNLGGGIDASTAKLFKFNEGARGLGFVLSALKLPVFAQGFLAIGTAANTAGAGVVALLGPLGSLSGLLGALPTSGIALLSSMVVGKSTITGLGAAIKEQEANTKSAAAATVAQGKAQSTAAVQARQLSSALDTITAAERGVTMAQRNAIEAQERLAEARKEASERLFDMRHASKSAALDEQQALYDVLDARKALSATSDDQWVFGKGYVTSDDVKGRDKQNERRDALMNLRRAELALIRVREDRRRGEEDLAEAERKGIDNSDLVVNATRAQEEANYSLQQSIKALAEAHTNLADTRAAAATVDPTTGTTKLSTAEYDKLPQAGKDFVDYYTSTLKPTLEDLKEKSINSFAPGLLAGLQGAQPGLELFVSQLDIIGFALGDTVAKLGGLFGSDAWASDMNDVLSQAAGMIRGMGDGAMYFLDGMRNVAVAAEPLTRWIGDTAAKWGSMVKSWAEEGRADGSLSTFFEKSTVNADKLFEIFGNIYGTLKNMARAAEPLGDWLMDSLASATAAQEAWTASAEGQSKMAAYFEAQKEPLSQLARLFSEVAKALFRITTDPSVPKLVGMLTDKLLPALEDAITKFQGGELAPQLIDGLVNVVNLIGQFSEYQGGFQVMIGLLSTFAGLLGDLLEHNPALLTLVTTWMSLNAALKVTNFIGAVTGLGKLSTMIGSGAGKGLAYSTGMLVGRMKALSIVGPAAVAAVAGGVALYSSYKSWKATGDEIERVLGLMDDMAKKGDIAGLISEQDKFRSEYDAAYMRLTNANNANPAEKVGIGLKTAWGELMGQRTIVDDARLMEERVDEMNKKFIDQTNLAVATKLAHTGLAAAIGVTGDKMAELIAKYDLDPLKTETSLGILGEHVEEWGGLSRAIGEAVDAMHRYWRAQKAPTIFTNQADAADAKRDFGELQAPALKGNRVDTSSEGTQALISNLQTQAGSTFDAIMGQLDAGQITTEKAKEMMLEFGIGLEEALTEKLGGNREAAKHFIASVLGANYLPAAIAKMDSAVTEWNKEIVTRLADTTTTAGERWKNLTELIRLNGFELDTATTKGKLARDAMRDWVGGVMGGAITTLGKLNLNTEEYRGHLVKMTDELLDQITPWFKNRDAAGEYLAKLGVIPPDVVTKAVADTAEAEANWAEYQAMLQGIAWQQQLVRAATDILPSFLVGSGKKEKDGPGRAGGGNFGPGSWLVGERGVERMHVDSSGHGRIEPTGVGAMYPTGSGQGLTVADIERAFRNALASIDFTKKVEMQNNFPDGTNPKTAAAEIAWAIR